MRASPFMDRIDCWLYVVLSRVKTLSGFFTMVKLCPDIKKYKPRYDVIDEMKRLKDVEMKTITRLKTCI